MHPLREGELVGVVIVEFFDFGRGRFGRPADDLFEHLLHSQALFDVRSQLRLGDPLFFERGGEILGGRVALPEFEHGLVHLRRLDRHLPIARLPL